MISVDDGNPFRDKTDTELFSEAEGFAAAQENLASRTTEDRTHWHHRAIAWLIHELAARMVKKEPVPR